MSKEIKEINEDNLQRDAEQEGPSSPPPDQIMSDDYSKPEFRKRTTRLLQTPSPKRRKVDRSNGDLGDLGEIELLDNLEENTDPQTPFEADFLQKGILVPIDTSSNTKSEDDSELLECQNHAKKAIENCDLGELKKSLIETKIQKILILELCNNGTILHLAIAAKNELVPNEEKNEILEYLIDSFGDLIDISKEAWLDKDGNSILHLMADSQNEVSTEIFKKCFDSMSKQDGFNINYLNGSGQTIQQIANESEAQEIANIISQYDNSQTSPRSNPQPGNSNALAGNIGNIPKI